MINNINSKRNGFIHLQIIVVALVAIMGIGAVGGYVVFESQAASNIIDVSYPQCGEAEKNLGSDRAGIIGVNGGGNFTKNPCLAKLATHFGDISLYANSNYPSDGCPSGLSAYDCGYKAGRYTINYATSQKVKSKRWWIDVETMNTWSGTKAQHKNFLKGMYDALRLGDQKDIESQSPNTVGYYSTSYQWGVITGGWTNGKLAWVATGQYTKPSSATIEKLCDKDNSFTGGTVKYIQYINNNLDTNIKC